jgi:hypothetical protein
VHVCCSIYITVLYYIEREKKNERKAERERESMLEQEREREKLLLPIAALPPPVISN